MLTVPVLLRLAAMVRPPPTPGSTVRAPSLNSLPLEAVSVALVFIPHPIVSRMIVPPFVKLAAAVSSALFRPQSTPWIRRVCAEATSPL